MLTLWSDMDRLFNILNNCDHRFSAAQPKFRMNLQDKGENLEFIAELPGISDKDMNLEIHNDTLTLSAKRDIKRNKENTFYLTERGSWNIQKSISLPVAVEVDNTKAVLKDGMLRVTMPKAQNSRPQQIAINCN